jgi:predicted porin
MNDFKRFILAGGASLVLASAAQAADLPTNKQAPAAPAPPTLASCANIQQFFTTACPLTYAGVTFYGTIDVGAGYQTHTTPFNSYALFGVQDFIQKSSNHPAWVFVPNGLSQSNVGVKVKEDIGLGWSFVGLAETGFDPYSLQLANGPRSLAENTTTPLAFQSSSGDSSRAGQLFNSQVFAGVSNPTFGTLTAGRVNTLTLDGVNAYDPMGGSYAFSPIGLSGTTAGAGDTETARFNSALKYRVAVGPVRAAAEYQFGGYEQGNASNGGYQFQLGGDLLGLSLDAIYSHMKDAEALSTYNGPAPFGAPNDALKLTISDNSSIMLLAKYTWNHVSFFGGFENVLFQDPSDVYTGSTLTALGGFPGIVQKNAYDINRTLQIYWTGAKYAVTPDIDLTGAYYHYHQLDYSAKPCANSSAGTCDGTMDAVSAMVDWRFAKKFDAYAGVMFSEVNNGLANGYIAHATADPTVGLRFRF